MKFQLPVLAASVAVMASCSGASVYTVSGNDPFFAGHEGEYVYLVTNYEWKVLDSAMVENSSFRIEGECDSPEIVFAYLGKYPDKATNIGNSFILEEGNILARKKSEGWFSFGGTPLNDELLDVFKEFRSKGNGGGGLDFLEEAIARHPDILGVSLLCDYYLLSGGSAMTAARLMDGFPEELRNTPPMVFMEENLAKVRTDTGEKYIDIKGVTPDGESADLGSVVSGDAAKYVLLDFWATWCSGCIESLSALKSAYSEYGDKGFDIYAVSFDQDRDRWSDFVDEHCAGWTNVIMDVPEGGFRAIPEARAYGIGGLPWNYLIDCSTGKIIGKNLYGERLLSCLSGLLAE